jgi:hypothetical protein
MLQQFFKTLGTDTVPFMRLLVRIFSYHPNTARSTIGLRRAKTDVW